MNDAREPGIRAQVPPEIPPRRPVATGRDQHLIDRIESQESHIERFRRLIEEQYHDHPTGCGGSFGELLCWEIHCNGKTFKWLAEKWGVSLPMLGLLIADHCNRLEEDPVVNHRSPPGSPTWS